MTTPAVAFDSPEDFDRHDAARAQVEAWVRSTARLPAEQPWFRPAASTTKCWVEITEDRVAGDSRYVYPAKFVSFDENETSSSVAPKWGDSDEPEALERVCVCVAPNGEVLKKKVRHEGQVYGTVVVPEPTPAELAGVLATRTDGVSGEIELDSAAPTSSLEEGDVIRITWAAGYQTGHTVTSLTDGTIVAFAGGGLTPEESELPVVGTAVVVTRVRSVEIAVVMVDCSDAVEFVRTTSFRNEDGDYRGYVQEWDMVTRSWTDGEEVWVRNAN